MKHLKLILPLIFIMLMASCVTKKACNNKFPPVESSIQKDSTYVRDSIVYKPIPVPVYIKGDSITKTDTVEVSVETNLANSKPVFAETDFAKAKAQVKNGILTLQLIQKDTLFQVEAMAKEAYYWKEKYNSKEVTKVVTVKETRKFMQVMGIIGIVLCSLGILYVLWTILQLLNFKL